MEKMGGREEEWSKNLTLGPAELGDGVDEALVEVGGPPEAGLGVRRQHEARRAAGARHLAGHRAVRAVVDQARGEHLLLLLHSSQEQRKRERDRDLLLLLRSQKRSRIQRKGPRLSLPCLLLLFCCRFFQCCQ
jgi:hypothetical protein